MKIGTAGQPFGLSPRLNAPHCSNPEQAPDLRSHHPGKRAISQQTSDLTKNLSSQQPETCFAPEVWHKFAPHECARWNS